MYLCIYTFMLNFPDEIFLWMGAKAETRKPLLSLIAVQNFQYIHRKQHSFIREKHNNAVTDVIALKTIFLVKI
jgi:hypothetical protein